MAQAVIKGRSLKINIGVCVAMVTLSTVVYLCSCYVVGVAALINSTDCKAHFNLLLSRSAAALRSCFRLRAGQRFAPSLIIPQGRAKRNPFFKKRVTHYPFSFLKRRVLSEGQGVPPAPPLVCPLSIRIFGITELDRFPVERGKAAAENLRRSNQALVIIITPTKTAVEKIESKSAGFE